MNRYFKISAFAIVATGLLACMSCGQAKDDQPFRFIVISDTHFGKTDAMGKVTQTLQCLLNKEPMADAVFVVGDITNNGLPEQYEQAAAVFSDTAFVPAGVAVYLLGGNNHDNQNNGYEIISKILKQPMNQYIEIKGYPFITISEGGHHYGNPDSVEYNRAAKAFLAENLARAAKKFPGKPIFVFMHVPPENTCYGSLRSEGWGTPYFSEVMNQYPQIVVFGGHSHYPVGDPRSINQDIFTSINDGSCTYSEVAPGEVSMGVHPENYTNVTEGLIVNVMSDRSLQIERWDTYRNEEILPVWVVEAPHDGSRFTYKGRTGLPEPAFNTGEKVSVSDAASDSCVVAFAQATDEENVFRYKIDILRSSGKDVAATPTVTWYLFSQFYLNSDTPSALSAVIHGLSPGVRYVARVTALDSYNNASQPIESEPFIVKKK